MKELKLIIIQPTQLKTCPDFYPLGNITAPTLEPDPTSKKLNNLTGYEPCCSDGLQYALQFQFSL
jgi:hypothetical protein